MPYRLAFVMGGLMELGAALVRATGDPPLSRSMVRFIGREFTTNDAAARRELGYVGRLSRQEGLATYSAALSRSSRGPVHPHPEASHP